MWEAKANGILLSNLVWMRNIYPCITQVGEDAFLLFWDLRAGSMMGGYWEAHDDDVTCVK